MDEILEHKIYISAKDVATVLDISVGHAYKVIHRLNEELEKDGYYVIAGKIPKKYFEKRWYGCGEEVLIK